MRTKANNKSSDVSTSVKITGTSYKPAGSSKRITSDHKDQSVKKGRKLSVPEGTNRKALSPKSNVDGEKSQKKLSLDKKSFGNLKKIKKPNEKYKRICCKIDKRTKKGKNELKKVTRPAEKLEEHDGPPTLSETFSRITTMVAETVINEKENSKLAESILGKVKKEAATADKSKREINNGEPGAGKSKGDLSAMDAPGCKIKKESTQTSDCTLVKSKKESSKTVVDISKKAKLVPSKSKFKFEKLKPKMKKVSAKGNSAKKSEKQAPESCTKPSKDDELLQTSGRGINTRRISLPGSSESEKEAEQKFDSEKQKSFSQGNSNIAKSSNVTKPTEKVKHEKKSPIPGKTAFKRKENARAKSDSKEKKPKIKDSQLQAKKLVDDMRKSLDKDRDREKDKDKEEDSKQQEGPSKKASKQATVKKNIAVTRNKPSLKASSETSRGRKSKKKDGTSVTKSGKPKVGSETDGSNSDELTLNILQKKARKLDKTESAAGTPKIKSENTHEDVKVKVEGKVEGSEKNSGEKITKSKKIKVEKEEDEVPGLEKKIFEEILKKRRGKETESDTDEDLEFRRLLAKKLTKSIEVDSSPRVKRKRMEGGHSDSEQRARRLRLFGFWSGPKRHRVASLNALAKVHCLYENESKGVMSEIEKMGQILKSDSKNEKKTCKKLDKKKDEEESETEKLDSIVVNKRTLRGTPGTRGAGKHWDMFAAEFTTSTSCASSDESHSDTDGSKSRPLPLPPSYRQKMQKKEENDKEDASKTPKRRRKTDIGVTMDLKDMVVRKRMASLNASAILAASYSSEKRSNRKDSSFTSTEDSLSSPDEGRADFLSADDSDNCTGKKPCSDKSFASTEITGDKTRDLQSGGEREDNKRRKNFWKTKVENLKKASKEKRNSPSPILADFGVDRGLSATVLEKEKKDELNDDKGKDNGKGSCKISYSRKYSETKVKSRDKYGDEVINKSAKDKDSRRGKLHEAKEGGGNSRKKFAKRKSQDGEVKNINIEKMSGSEKGDEYEYKSDSDNGQRKLIELRNTGGSNKKVAVIVNQDTDVTITGVYVNSTRSTHHEGFCSIAGMQYRISSTSHTQTEATAVLKTSIASEQTPPPTEPTNCTSPRNHKSYTPLSALSNMQPPAGAPPHPHLPPPPLPPHHHHHHHHCGMGQHGPPPEHYMGHGPPQGPISPLGRRHGCSSAFSAPHCSSQAPPGRHSSPGRDDDGFGPPLPSHGYFQPAGPLIHHHASNPPVKGHNVASLDSNSSSETQGTGAGGEDVTEASRSGENPPPPPSTAHHMGYPRGYPPYQGGHYQGSYYYPPPPPQSSHYQAPPPAFHHYHHHQDFCYPPGYPPSSYPPPAAYRRFLQPAPGYFSSEVTYSSSVPPTSQDHGTQQMVVPGSPSSSYTAPLDPYPPPAPYYAGYSAPGPACYTHPPTSRSLALIEQTYQSCPCPMQSCPKNVHIGPLTGECKRPGALPLPPVALQLPQEPPGAAGPPSPARGSAGMPPLPSPVSNSARPNCGPSWDGRPTKSTAMEPCPDIRWDEAKTKLEVKSKCKAEFLQADTKGTWNATDLTKTSVTKCFTVRKTELTDREWEIVSEGRKEQTTHDGFPQGQGLLVISSTELSKVPARNLQASMEITRNLDLGSKIKTENEKITTDDIKLLKEENSQTIRKRKSSGEEGHKSGKRKKQEDDESPTVVLSEDSLKKSKRKHEASDENTENKVKKMKRKLTVNQKDENEFDNTAGNTRKGQRNLTHSKPKLLKDRNETVSCDTVAEVIEQVIKGQTNWRNKKPDEHKLGGEKISTRRKSNQEKWTGTYAAAQCPRKSRSCSPSRSAKSRSNSISPVRSIRDEARKKLSSEHGNTKGTRNVGKCKADGKPKSNSDRISHEHSKNSKSNKKNSGSGIMAKSKNAVVVIGRTAQQHSSVGFKSKKAKSDGSVSPENPKKPLATKNVSMSPKSGISPKWSNGWSWDGDSFDAKVYLTNDEAPVMRKCYSAMRHVEGDVIQPKDCILLKAGPRKIDLPFVAKVAALWENPDDGEMMVSLLWYYRPEHTDQGRQSSDQQDEIFASRHKDINSVACIEDKCFVLTYNEYCRYRKKVKGSEEGVGEKSPPVPGLDLPYPRSHRQPPCIMAPDMVFFCRRVYDFRQKRLLKNPT